MYYMISVLMFFFLPPVGGVMLMLGLGFNLAVMAFDHFYRLRKARAPHPRHLADPV